MRIYPYLIFLLVSLRALADAQDPAGPRVDFFAPQGTVKGARQVQARFSEPMVRFGDPRLAAPFTRDCPAAGSGRWADARNWVFDFDADVPAGLRCEFRLAPDLKSLSGQAVAASGPYVFDSGGPTIVDSLPEEGSNAVDEEQAFILRLDAPVRPESVAQAVHCEIGGIAERIDVDLVEGAAREELLSKAVRTRYEWFFADGDGAGGSVLALRCRRHLPPDTDVRLLWGAGVASVSGVASKADQVLSFKTRPAFSASFQCERVNANAQCVPLLPMTLRFSAPIPADKAWTIRLSNGQGKEYPKEAMDPARTPVVDHVTFKGPFPEKSTFTLTLPESLTDDAGRSLENAGRFPLTVETDEYPPLVKFSAAFGILEAKQGGVLPVTLRNVEAPVTGKQTAPIGKIPGRVQRVMRGDREIIFWLKKVAEAGRTRFERETLPSGETAWKNLTGAESVFAQDDTTQLIEVPKPEGQKAFEVVGIPLAEPGFYVVELASPRLGAALLGEPRPRYVATSALVTNLGVHFKWGRESSLVWVTALDSAQPIADAELRISDYCTGDQLWRGRTGDSGLARIDGAALPHPHGGDECSEWSEAHPLLISARQGDDLGFSLSGWNQGIQPGDFKLETGSAYESKVAHTVFDRTLLRAGETLSMKHYWRQRTAAGFAVPGDQRPDRLLISHSGSGDKYELPLAFDAQGIAESVWAIPRDAKLGTYELSWYQGERWLADSGNFRVEQFRVPTMQAVIQPTETALVNPREATLDLFVRYLSGGGASGAAVKLRAQMEPRSLVFADYADFSFGGGDVREGLVEEGAEDEPQHSPARTVPLALDKTGAVRHTLTELPVVGRASELITELEYQDANGERLSTARRIPVWPAAVNLGLRPDGWAASKEQLRFQALALDLSGKPVSGQAVQVELFHKITYSYRKRLIGGFYAYEDKSELQRLPQTCRGNTDKGGLIPCDLKPGVSGSVILRASTRDALGNTAIATREVWVANGDDWWFTGGPSDRMDLLPEKKAYQHGEQAQLQVRMPFREATALVTVEREGVLDAFVTPLSGTEPVIRLPIKDHYAPNVYVSVLALRGRAEESQGWFRALAEQVGLAERKVSETPLVDLNKPAYRLGLAAIEVGWAPYRLDVAVKTDREVYKVRDKVQLKLAVKPAAGTVLPADAEVAVAAVDEGLLELKPNESWNLLEHMMGRRGIEVYTSTAQMQVVGKRHYGRKAIPHGGGGGQQAARELFDTLLLWRGRVALDGQGEATLDVPLNDSLTAFRLVAVASAGSDHFGTGQASIRTTQDLMLHGGLPPVVREGDTFKSLFTVRNASARSLALKVSARVAGLDGPGAVAATGAESAAAAPFGKELPPVMLELAAGQAREVPWEVNVPVDARELDWEVTAEAVDGSARDRLKVKQAVMSTHPVQVYQATLTQVDQPIALPVERPQDALPGRGGVRVSLRARLGDGLGGVSEYMARYPYNCLEQRVSRAIARHDDALWDGIVKELPGYLDGDGLFKYFAAERLQGSDVLSAYVLSITQAAGRSLPDEVRKQALEGLKHVVAGRVLRHSPLPTADLALRKLAAIRALAQYGEASPTMLDSIAIEPTLWPTSALLDWIAILKSVQGIAAGPERLLEAQQLLRARLNFQGSTLGFSTESSDALWWLMVSADENAVRAVLTLADMPAWREDMPRLVTGALGRQQGGHWATTPANAWGVLALAKFSQLFESTPVTGYTEASLDGSRKGMEWSENTRQSALNFPWPKAQSSLELKHSGTGKPWAVVQSRAAIPLRQPVFTGFQIRRRVSPVEQSQPGVWSRGDVARIRLELEAQSDMTWVVVDDPIPAGSTILGSGLGGDSALLVAGEEPAGWTAPVFQERRFDGLRAYYDYVPKGRWVLEYTVRFNNPGRFTLPATRVEALYVPEMFGALPNPPLEITGGP